MKAVKLITLSTIALIMTGCASWGAAYQKNYNSMLAAEVTCGEDSVIIHEYVDSGGNPARFTAPGANVCGDVATPRHEGDVYAPYVGAASSLAGVFYSEYKRNQTAERDAEAREIISANNLAEAESRDGVFTGLVDSNANLTQQLIDLTTPAEEPVVEPPMDEVIEVITPTPDP